MLPSDPLDLNIIVLCGGNTARYWVMKERLKDFRQVCYFDNVGYNCTEGHERILKHAMATSSSSDYTLIMEDDACLMESFFDIYPRLLAVDYSRCDLLYLGGNLLNPPARKIMENIYEPKPISLYATHAYLISKRSYDVVIELIEKDKHRYIIDDIYTRAPASLKTLFVCPPMVTQLPPDGSLEKNLFLHEIMMRGFKQHIGS